MSFMFVLWSMELIYENTYFVIHKHIYVDMNAWDGRMMI